MHANITLKKNTWKKLLKYLLLVLPFLYPPSVSKAFQSFIKTWPTFSYPTHLLTSCRALSVTNNKMKWLFTLPMTFRFTRPGFKAETLGSTDKCSSRYFRSSGWVLWSSWFLHPHVIDATLSEVTALVYQDELGHFLWLISLRLSHNQSQLHYLLKDTVNHITFFNKSLWLK